MEQQKKLCEYAERALAVASCAQMLCEAGFKILHIKIGDTDAVVSISYCPKVKTMNGTACGSTYIKGDEYFVYQKDICGAVVRWIEPNFDMLSIARRLH